MNSNRIRKLSTYLLIGLLLFFVAFFVKAYIDGNFDSKESLQTYISGFGLLAPLVLTLIQVMQVIVPVIPGFLGCIVGAMAFGCMGGFWCNYVGISLGSIIAFYLARIYGQDMVRGLFSQKKYEKWSNWIETKKYYSFMLFIAMLLPLFPDDFFCYFTGLTNMKPKKYIWIILLGKPWCLLIYSIIFSAI